jgi:nucleoside-diphosphate-sugar epimerase
MSIDRNRYLPIGARGFIGEWTCKLLIEAEFRVMAADASPDPRSADCVLTHVHIRELDSVVCDARDGAALSKVVGDHVAHVIYLAGLLRPASEDSPWLSAQVSIGGLMNVFRAVLAGDRGVKIALLPAASLTEPCRISLT